MPDGGLSCPSCGAVVDPADQFCGYCGGRMPAEVPAEPPAPPPPPPPRVEPQPQPIQSPADPTKQRGSVTSETPPEFRSGFWARYSGLGLTAIRVALGFLFIFPRNPLMFGDPWFALETGSYAWDVAPHVEYWAQAVVLTDGRDFFYAICITQILAGTFIVLGLLFRPACVLMAATFMGIWTFLFLYGTTIEIQLGYLAFAVAFLGLMLAGPGRLALRRKRD